MLLFPNLLTFHPSYTTQKQSGEVLPSCANLQQLSISLSSPKVVESIFEALPSVGCGLKKLSISGFEDEVRDKCNNPRDLENQRREIQDSIKVLQRKMDHPALQELKVLSWRWDRPYVAGTEGVGSSWK